VLQALRSTYCRQRSNAVVAGACDGMLHPAEESSSGRWVYRGWRLPCLHGVLFTIVRPGVKGSLGWVCALVWQPQLPQASVCAGAAAFLGLAHCTGASTLVLAIPVASALRGGHAATHGPCLVPRLRHIPRCDLQQQWDMVPA
jgi:hypothetical protein